MTILTVSFPPDTFIIFAFVCNILFSKSSFKETIVKTTGISISSAWFWTNSVVVGAFKTTAVAPCNSASKANIINVSGGKDTVKIVKKLREIDPNFPIIATGGPTEETVREVIQAGANAVTFTPPTNGEIFKGMMEEYRHRYD